MKKVIHTHNYTKLAGGQHEENGTHNYIKLAGGQHEELGGQKQSAQSRDSLNRSQYKETALLDTTP